MKSEKGLRNSGIVKLPLYIYSYESDQKILHATSLLTGKSFVRVIPSFRFKMYSSWCALPYHYICFTGGCHEEIVSINEVVTLDTRREYAVQMKTPMITVRAYHQSVFHEGFLYVLSGFNYTKGSLSECERYSLADNQWETIPSIPTAVSSFGVIQLNDNRAIYVFGGDDKGSPVNLIQELNLERLEWRILNLRLPSSAYHLTVFKVRESDCYFVDREELYFYHPSTSKMFRVKTLQDCIRSFFGPSYYSKGILYCTNFEGDVSCSTVGRLPKSG